jgi:hypothetical protein
MFLYNFKMASNRFTKQQIEFLKKQNEWKKTLNTHDKLATTISDTLSFLDNISEKDIRKITERAETEVANDITKKMPLIPRKRSVTMSKPYVPKVPFSKRSVTTIPTTQQCRERSKSTVSHIISESKVLELRLNYLREQQEKEETKIREKREKDEAQIRQLELEENYVEIDIHLWNPKIIKYIKIYLGEKYVDKFLKRDGRAGVIYVQNFILGFSSDEIFKKSDPYYNFYLLLDLPRLKCEIKKILNSDMLEINDIIRLYRIIHTRIDICDNDDIFDKYKTIIENTMSLIF